MLNEILRILALSNARSNTRHSTCALSKPVVFCLFVWSGSLGSLIFTRKSWSLTGRCADDSSCLWDGFASCWCWRASMHCQCEERFWMNGEGFRGIGRCFGVCRALSQKPKCWADDLKTTQVSMCAIMFWKLNDKDFGVRPPAFWRRLLCAFYVHLYSFSWEPATSWGYPSSVARFSRPGLICPWAHCVDFGTQLSYITVLRMIPWWFLCAVVWQPGARLKVLREFALRRWHGQQSRGVQEVESALPNSILVLVLECLKKWILGFNLSQFVPPTCQEWMIRPMAY